MCCGRHRGRRRSTSAEQPVAEGAMAMVLGLPAYPHHAVMEDPHDAVVEHLRDTVVENWHRRLADNPSAVGVFLNSLVTRSE